VDIQNNRFLNIIIKPTLNQLFLGRFIILISAFIWILLLSGSKDIIGNINQLSLRSIGNDFIWLIIFYNILIFQYLTIQNIIKQKLLITLYDTLTAFVWVFITVGFFAIDNSVIILTASEISITFITIWIWIHTLFFNFFDSN
jgi:hypothetical protein